MKLSEMEIGASVQVIAGAKEAEKSFDEALTRIFQPQRDEFLKEQARHESLYKIKETDAELKNKAELIKERMKTGRKTTDICNDEDISLGESAERFLFAKYFAVIPALKNMSVAEWEKKELYSRAYGFISKFMRGN